MAFGQWPHFHLSKWYTSFSIWIRRVFETQYTPTSFTSLSMRIISNYFFSSPSVCMAHYLLPSTCLLAQLWLSHVISALMKSCSLCSMMPIKIWVSRKQLLKISKWNTPHKLVMASAMVTVLVLTLLASVSCCHFLAL